MNRREFLAALGAMALPVKASVEKYTEPKKAVIVPSGKQDVLGACIIDAKYWRLDTHYVEVPPVWDHQGGYIPSSRYLSYSTLHIETMQLF